MNLVQNVFCKNLNKLNIFHNYYAMNNIYLLVDEIINSNYYVQIKDGRMDTTGICSSLTFIFRNLKFLMIILMSMDIKPAIMIYF